MPEVKDRRTQDEKKSTWGYVVMNDNFLSGWGHAPARSLYCLAVANDKQRQIVMQNAHNRSEMKRVRFNLHLPSIRDGDHLSIVGPTAASGWYEEGTFKPEPRRKA